ncbi:MAG: SH3 domain-containing protein [Elusimicrobiaceae bacterium]|nr:SH3 domain-containing protein [Elusimicrobiaceae bacterium]
MKKLFLISLTLFLSCNAFAVARYASVVVKEGKIRSCPSTKCSKKFLVWKYTPLEMFGVSKNRQWVQVKDFEGYAGWIHSDLLGETPALVAKTDINVRKQPSASSEVVWIVEKGYPLKFIKKQGSWLQVADDAGLKGWVHSSVVWGFLQYRK